LLALRATPARVTSRSSSARSPRRSWKTGRGVAYREISRDLRDSHHRRSTRESIRDFRRAPGNWPRIAPMSSRRSSWNPSRLGCGRRSWRLIRSPMMEMITAPRQPLHQRAERELLVPPLNPAL